MRPSGPLHLADMFGVVAQWLQLQQQHECLFFVADWHALTVDPAQAGLRRHVLDLLVDWLAVGLDPKLAMLFQQSRVPEVAELNLLLGICTPLTWLERTAVARVEAVADASAIVPGAATAAPWPAHASALGFDTPAASAVGGGSADCSSGTPTLGQLDYPLLQCADILLYRATHACVVPEQTPHVELCRDVARRFNHLFGREADAETKTARALRQLGSRLGSELRAHRRAYQEQGDETALRAGLRLIDDAPRLTLADHERLVAYLEGGGRAVLGEPEGMVVAGPPLPGTDGRPMSHQAENVILVRDEPDDIRGKLRKMPTDPARVRRQDPGNPENCPVWRYHDRLSDDATQRWAYDGCRTARIGCTDCKRRAAEVVIMRLEPVAKRAREYARNPEVVRSVVVEGAERAREIARDTLQSVRHAMNLE